MSKEQRIKSAQKAVADNDAKIKELQAKAKDLKRAYSDAITSSDPGPSPSRATEFTD